MTARRLSAFAALLIALTGCHDDPEVVTILVGGTATGLTIEAVGGSSTATAPAVAATGAGGNGGAVNLSSNETMNVGVVFTALTAPTAPTAPATGTTIATGAIAADINQAGNVLLSGIYTDGLSGAPPRLIQSTTGDIVLSGTLTAFDPGAGATQAITLDAPNGTVYITGTLRMDDVVLVSEQGARQLGPVFPRTMAAIEGAMGRTLASRERILGGAAP